MVQPSRQTSGGGCFVALGGIALIISCVYIVKPAMKGMAFTPTTCTIVGKELGDSNNHLCNCGAYCQSLAPCTIVYVTFPGGSNMSVFHLGITDLIRLPMCTLNNLDCTASPAVNVQASRNFLDKYFPINSTLSCLHDGDDVIGALEYSKRDIVFAILWPSLLILLGLCMCGAAEGRSVGATIFMAPCLCVIVAFAFIYSGISKAAGYVRGKLGRCSRVSNASTRARPRALPADPDDNAEVLHMDYSSAFRRHHLAVDQPPRYDTVVADGEDYPPPIDAPFVPLLPLSSTTTPTTTTAAATSQADGGGEDRPPAYSHLGSTHA